MFYGKKFLLKIFYSIKTTKLIFQLMSKEEKAHLPQFFLFTRHSRNEKENVMKFDALIKFTMMLL